MKGSPTRAGRVGTSPRGLTEPAGQTRAIDAHCHADLLHLNKAAVAGVEAVVVAGIAPEHFGRQSAAVARLRHLGLDARLTVGVHPWSVCVDGLDDQLALLDAILAKRTADVVGVGELGLDRHRAESPDQWAAQNRAFEAQLDRAKQIGLPAVLHVVKAHSEALAVVRRVGVPAAGLQVHGFTGSAELVDRWVALGAMLSVGGLVTGRTSDKRLAGLRAIPDTHLLVETDAPDQPVAAARAAHRPGQPRDVWDVLVALAELRGQSVQHLARVTAENARRLFGLDRTRASPT